MPLMIALVIALIVDLDHPRGGLITIKQQALLDLQGVMVKGTRCEGGYWSLLRPVRRRF